MVAQKRLPLTGPAMVFVTTTVHKWTPIFAQDKYARLMVAQLNETLSHYRVSMCAYVLMPSHLHALLGFPEIGRLSQVMKMIKGLSARRLRPLLTPELATAFESNGRYLLWKRRFDDVIIWSEKQFRTKAEYIHNNPVRAGLVQHSNDYKYSSAGDWLLDNPGLIHVNKTWKWQR